MPAGVIAAGDRYVLDVADFLFPKDLQTTKLEFKSILLIGSCMSELYLEAFNNLSPGTRIDFILYNNVGELSDLPPRPLIEYDFQYIQIPLNSLVGSGIQNFTAFSDLTQNQDVSENSQNLLRLMIEGVLKYNKSANIITFVQNFIVPQTAAVAALSRRGTQFDVRYLVETLNRLLVELLADYENVYLIDAEAIASSMGKRYFLDDWANFFAHGSLWFPHWATLDPDRIEPVPPLESISHSHAGQFCSAIWRACEHNIRVINQIDSVKLVIFDLDDTLWRGLIGEQYGVKDNSEFWMGWPVGVHEAIQHLKARGILVAVCSKNSPEIVKERWHAAIPYNWLMLDEFVAVEIGWNPKVEGIARIMSEVSLTPRSVLFVDDNPVERQAVMDAFPGIRATGANPWDIRRILLNASETQIRVLTDESVSRDTMVRRQRERESERKALSREEFLASLNCRVTLSKVLGLNDSHFDRTFELLNKTNQFNTNGERWSQRQMEEHFEKGGEVVTFSVEDRFTSYGLVGVILMRGETINQFVMSCRVLGLDIEIGVLSELLRDFFCRNDSIQVSPSDAGTRSQRRFVEGLLFRFKQSKTDPNTSEEEKKMTASIVETTSNLPCRDVFVRAGFVSVSEGIYVAEPSQVRAVPPHLFVGWAE